MYMFWCSKLIFSIRRSTHASNINYQIQFQEHQNDKTSKHKTIKFTQIKTKQSSSEYSQPIQENKLAININLRLYNLLVTHYHSYNKRKRAKLLIPLTSNEAIAQQGKGRRSRDHS